MTIAPAELVAAVKSGDTAAVAARLRTDPALAGATDDTGLSLTLLALFHMKREAADAILAAGPELGVLEAAATGDAARLEALLTEDPGRLGERTPEGFDPIGLAAFLGGPDAVRVLLAHGADPDGDPGNPMRSRPVHAASAAGDNASLRLLLEAGADPNAEQQGGFTPLDAADRLGDEEMRALLVRHGARC